MFQDRFDVSVGAGAGRHRAGARGLESLSAVALGQPENAEARAVALLGVPALREDRARELPRLGPDALGPAHDPRRRPLQVLLVALGHVLGLRRVTTPLVAPRVRRQSLHAAIDLHRRSRRAYIELGAEQ